MKLTNFSKRVLVIFLLCGVLIMCGIVVMQVNKYAQAKQLCEDIKNGKEIDTKIGNATTAPLFIDEIAAIFQVEGVKIPLVEACYYRHSQAVQVLLENGADPNFFIEGRWSPLEAAIIHGSVDEKSVEIIELLIEHGVDVDAHASDTPVIEIITDRMARGNTSDQMEQVVKMLVSADASIEVRLGGTIFRYLISGGHIELTEWLMEERNIDVNERGYEGMTPLMLVARISPDESVQTSVEWLLDHGADISIKDDNGKTAYDYAMEKGRTEIAELLKP